MLFIMRIQNILFPFRGHIQVITTPPLSMMEIAIKGLWIATNNIRMMKIQCISIYAQVKRSNSGIINFTGLFDSDDPIAPYPQPPTSFWFCSWNSDRILLIRLSQKRERYLSSRFNFLYRLSSLNNNVLITCLILTKTRLRLTSLTRPRSALWIFPSLIWSPPHSPLSSATELAGVMMVHSLTQDTQDTAHSDQLVCAEPLDNTQ